MEMKTISFINQVAYHRVQMRVTDRHNNQQETQVDDMNIVYDKTIGDGGNGQRQVRLPTSVAVNPGTVGLQRVVYVSENGKDCVGYLVLYHFVILME